MTKLKLNGNGNGNGHNGNGNGHNGNGKSALKIALLAVAVLAAGVLLYRLADRFTGPTREVWVASGNLSPGVLLSQDDFQRQSFRESDLPQDAVDAGSEEDLEGRQLVRPKQEGEPFVRGDVTTPRTPEQQAASLAELLPEGRVLTTVQVQVMSVLMNELRFGDRILPSSQSRTRGNPRPRSGPAVVSSRASWRRPPSCSIAAGAGLGRRLPRTCCWPSIRRMFSR
jgi:hypothetical protein